TRRAPVVPPAPLTFSMMTSFLRSSLKRGARMRATTSDALPAGNGTTKVTGLRGHGGGSCPVVWGAGDIDAREKTTTASILMLGTLPPCALVLDLDTLW